MTKDKSQINFNKQFSKCETVVVIDFSKLEFICFL